MLRGPGRDIAQGNVRLWDLDRGSFMGEASTEVPLGGWRREVEVREF